MKQKILLFILLGSILSAGAINMTKDRYRYSGFYGGYGDRYYDRVGVIEDKLDRLEDQYDRDKDRLDDRYYMDKYERKMRKKALKYEYKREKDRLKHEKKAIKKGYYRY